MFSIIVPSYDSEKNKKMREDLKIRIKEMSDREYEIIEIVDKNGYAQAVNKGILQAKSDDIVIISDDVDLTDNNWMDKFKTPFRTGEKIGIVTASMLREKSYISGNRKLTFNFGTIGFAYINRKMIEDVGLLDEQFKYGFEEDDLIIRMSEKGWKIANVQIRHKHNYAETMKDIPGMKEAFHKSHELFLKKHNLIDENWDYNNLEVERTLYESFRMNFVMGEHVKYRCPYCNNKIIMNFSD